jgi:hypothetical protein
MKWIMFFQTPYDRVKFRTDEFEEVTSMQYHKFVKFLYEGFFIKEREKLIDSLDSFKTILLDKSGDFIVVSPELDLSKYSFDELFELNGKKEDETNNLDTAVEQSKRLIEQLWKKSKEKNPFSLSKRKI